MAIEGSLEDVAVAGNSCLNWVTVVLAMKSWRCCSYSSTSCLVVALHEREQASECDLLQHRILTGHLQGIHYRVASGSEC